MSGQIDAQFVRFQRTGAPGDLAPVFDATAAELLRVARHLLPESRGASGGPEDLVQATFVTAIENASRFSPDKSVQKWLLGILNNHARNYRRRRAAMTGNEASLDELHEPRAVSPEEDAEARELRSWFQRSLASVPQPYRQVVQLRLVEELSTEAIAERLARPSGTVRTQCHRGMEFLRRAMPSGAALAACAGLAPARGIAVVRMEVLAGVRGAAMAAGATTSVVGALGLLATGLSVAVVFGTVWAVAWSQSSPAIRPVSVSRDGSDSRGMSLVTPVASGAASSEDVGREAVPSVGSVQGGAKFGARTKAVDGGLFLQVVDARGKPVPGATVEFESGAQEHPMARRYFSPKETDENGRLEEVVPDSIGYLLVRKEGVGTSGVQAIEARHKGGREPWRVVLHPCVMAQGTVYAADGLRVAGAVVHARTDGFGYQSRTTTDGNGNFRIGMDRSVLYEVRAEIGDERSDDYIVDPRVQRGSIAVHLAGAFRISGTVSHADGRAAPGAKLRLLEAGGHPNKPQDWERAAGVGGTFTFRLSRPGRYRLVAGHGDSPGSDILDVVLDESSRAVRQDVQLAAFEKIGGVVRLEGGRVLAGVRVVASATHAKHCETRTDAAGRFVLEQVHPRRDYVIEAFLSDVQRRELGVVSSSLPMGQSYGINLIMCSDGRQRVARKEKVASGTRDLVIDVAPDALVTCGLIGRIVDDVTGAPIESFQGRIVEIYSDRLSDKNFWADTREKGTFSVGGIPLGLRLQLEVRVDGYATEWFGPWRAVRGDREIELRMKRHGVVRCRVFRSGRPVVGARVSAKAKGFRAVRFHPPPLRTSDSGTAEVRLGPGRYVVTAEVGEAVGTATVTVRAGQTEKVDLLLQERRRD